MTPITDKSIGLDGRVFAERRGTLRRRVLKGARLVFGNRQCTLVGTARDLSSAGARIRFGDICAVAERFVLEIDGEAPRQAEVRWRSLTEVGVAFV